MNKKVFKEFHSVGTVICYTVGVDKSAQSCDVESEGQSRFIA